MGHRLRFFASGLLLLFTLIMISACGSQPAETPQVEGSPPPQTAALVSEAPAPEPHPAEQHPAEPTADPAAEETPQTHVVEIKNFSFSPANLEIKAGDTVTFINRDEVRHTGTADDGSFDTGLLGKDDEMQITFSTAGEFPYYCQPHPAMKGTIIVK